MSSVSTTETCFESKAIHISYNKQKNFIHVEWKGFASNSEYLEILTKQLQLTIQKQADKILYDLRKMAVVSTENQKYTNEVYFPQMAQAGSKYAAIVIPENIFGQASVNSILGKKNEALFEAKLFNNHQAAIEWLSQVN
jgi:hypothetical protein